MKMETILWILGFLVAGSVCFWLFWTDTALLRSAKVGSTWKKIHGGQSVTIFSVDYQEELIRFTAGGLMVYAMSFSAFFALYRLDGIPYEAIQKPITLADCAVIPPKDDTLC